MVSAVLISVGIVAVMGAYSNISRNQYISIQTEHMQRLALDKYDELVANRGFADPGSERRLLRSRRKQLPLAGDRDRNGHDEPVGPDCYRYVETRQQQRGERLRKWHRLSSAAVLDYRRRGDDTMNRRRGLTLMELMVSVGMSVFLVAAVVSAYSSAVAFDKRNTEYLQEAQISINFEQRIRTLLRGAYVSPTTTDTTTYFLGQTSGNSMDAAVADSLTFTTLSAGMNGSMLTTDDDFTALNDKYGPQGGIAEVGLSMTAVGDQGQSKQGLFLRMQRPSDGDYTQGGTESVLNADVKSIQFEFYNGTDWDPSWGTSGLSTQVTTPSQNNVQNGQDGRRIPAAVRVTYTLKADPDGTNHVFIVQLPHSDVTTENPIVASTTGATP